jgi:hypothetical protein
MAGSSFVEPTLVSIDLRMIQSGQRGRAFLSPVQFAAIGLETLSFELERRFLDEDDLARLPLLHQAVTSGTIVVETFPGEESPVEWHAFVRAPSVSEHPIFACVLAPLAVVERMVGMPPHMVLETATFQVIGADASPASIRSGLEEWVRRVWPGMAVPRIELRQWPDIEDADVWPAPVEATWPQIHLSPNPMVGARETLPPHEYAAP